VKRYLGVLGLLWSAAIAAEMVPSQRGPGYADRLGNLAGSLFGLFLFLPLKVVVVGSPRGAGHLYCAARLFQYLPRPTKASSSTSSGVDFGLLKPISSGFLATLFHPGVCRICSSEEC